MCSMLCSITIENFPPASKGGVSRISPAVAPSTPLKAILLLGYKEQSQLRDPVEGVTGVETLPPSPSACWTSVHP